jgi:hypothetical protein
MASRSAVTPPAGALARQPPQNRLPDPGATSPAPGQLNGVHLPG